jgi:hypothetical protein
MSVIWVKIRNRNQVLDSNLLVLEINCNLLDLEINCNLLDLDLESNCNLVDLESNCAARRHRAGRSFLFHEK